MRLYTPAAPLPLLVGFARGRRTARQDGAFSAFVVGGVFVVVVVVVIVVIVIIIVIIIIIVVVIVISVVVIVVSVVVASYSCGPSQRHVGSITHTSTLLALSILLAALP
jgi:hypothetical protein